MLATVPTRNPVLVLAAGVMGSLWGLQRRASAGLQAPVLTHLTWSTLMLRYLPPLFREFSEGRRAAGPTGGPQRNSAQGWASGPGARPFAVAPHRPRQGRSGEVGRRVVG